MEADMLVEVPSAVVNGTAERADVDAEVNNDQVLDCSCYRSAVNSPTEADLVVSRQSSVATSVAPSSYWQRDVTDMTSGPPTRRRCESCHSDVSVTSLPPSSASDDDMDSSLCKVAAANWISTSPGSSFALQADPDARRYDVSVKSTTTDHQTLSRDMTAVRRLSQSPPTPAGFSIADILRPDFGKPAVPDGLRQETNATNRRCPSYHHQSLLPSTVRRSLMHPYTAAAFCAAAVAAAAAAGVQGSNIRRHRGATISDQELARQQVTSGDVNRVKRLTSSRQPYDVSYHLVNNNNNNNAKHRSNYAYDDKEIGNASVVRQKTGSSTAPAVRRTRCDAAVLPSHHKTSTFAGAGRSQQSSVLSSPPAHQPASTSSTGAAERETVGDRPSSVDAKQQSGSATSSAALAPLPWPAWVYCTRYSDRPSSGPRTRKPKKKEHLVDEKRPRTAFTAAQLDRLKREFEESKYLTEERRQSLANELALNESQIKIWFQNKRAKMKKASGVRNQLALQLMAQGLYNHSSVVQR